jgi:hypothetical protein
MFAVSYFPRSYLNLMFPLCFASSSGWFYQTTGIIFTILFNKICANLTYSFILGITDHSAPSITEKYRISTDNKNNKGEIKQILFSKSRNDILFILLSKEILIMDTSLHSVSFIFFLSF